jgi:DNA mismatch repair ATPase MutS
MVKTSTRDAVVAAYQTAKAANPGMLLLFRLGDFYEAFGEDAQVAARVLGLTLTARGTVPMAGFPVDRLEQYLRRLLDDGRRVAVCDRADQGGTPATGPRLHEPSSPDLHGLAEYDAARPRYDQRTVLFVRGGHYVATFRSDAEVVARLYGRQPTRAGGTTFHSFHRDSLDECRGRLAAKGWSTAEVGPDHPPAETDRDAPKGRKKKRTEATPVPAAVPAQGSLF